MITESTVKSSSKCLPTNATIKLMKRVHFIYLSFLISFFVLISLINSWLSFSFWSLWLGGLIGSILPELDSLIYVFFVSPQELTSQRVIYFLKHANFLSAIKLLVETRQERNNLIFHSLTFTLISFLLLFWLVTSSGNIFALGVGFGINLHLLTNELIKRKYPIWYSTIGFGILLVLGIMA